MDIFKLECVNTSLSFWIPRLPFMPPKSSVMFFKKLNMGSNGIVSTPETSLDL